MRFRFQALGLHLLASIAALTLLLGALFAGWYRWPGWYLADAGRVALVLASVDVVAGPLLTFIIAAPGKPRRVLARDVAMIGVVQLAAMIYGGTQLWNGRPLYYAFSEDVLQVVQAYDIDPAELAESLRHDLPLAPHWYSLPRWIFVPLPQNQAERDKIVASAVSGGTDVIGMPQRYQTWEAGLLTLRTHLQPVDNLPYFSGNEKKRLKARMSAAGLAADQPITMAMMGRRRPLLAVFDPKRLVVVKLLRCD